MTEDRLTHLLNEATDLAPSAALRSRIERTTSPPPSGGEGPEVRGRLSWFALSGASAVLAVIAFLAIPRPASAAELIQKADQALHQALSYRIERDMFVGGAWRLNGSGLHAPGWRLETWSGGSFRLERPGALYRRDGSGPILMTHRFKPDPVQARLEDDLRLESYVRLLQHQQGRPGPGPSTTESARSPGDVREENGRRLTESGQSLQEVVVSEDHLPDRRTRFLIEEATSLPARIEIDRRIEGKWQGEWQVRFVYPGPAAGSESFTRPLRSGRIVDVDAKGGEIAIG